MEAIAYYDPGADITCQHTAGVAGGRCVSYPVARNVGGPSGISDLGDGVLGVTSHDVAAGGKVNIMRAPKVVPIECSGNVAIGAFVSTGTDGRIATSGS